MVPIKLRSVSTRSLLFQVLASNQHHQILEAANPLSVFQPLDIFLCPLSRCWPLFSPSLLPSDLSEIQASLVLGYLPPPPTMLGLVTNLNVPIKEAIKHKTQRGEEWIKEFSGSQSFSLNRRLNICVTKQT